MHGVRYLSLVAKPIIADYQAALSEVASPFPKLIFSYFLLSVPARCGPIEAPL
jgi:hypothetical protein